ncbi:MAG TPA: Abi-alpha family protein [Candidatus Sulfotelmatobacter sp.]|nr:Abi-alpha family protein [Candidatus Sulfotelmatobacter sp.]
MSDEENAALVIKTGVEQMFAPLQRLIDQLLGDAASEVGLTLGDSVRVWRFKRQLRLLQEVKRLIEQSGKDIKPIATRLFFPVLEAASIEDDDEMQTRWAALLANEATSVGSMHPSYIDILKQLAPDDARLLDKLCDWCEIHNTPRLTTVYVKPTRDSDREMDTLLASHGDALENLVRLGLIQTAHAMKQRGFRFVGESMTSIPVPSDVDSWYELSHFATRFVRACRAPRN